MTPEELLSPRYKIIADYPNSLYKLGQIIHERDNLEGATFFKTTIHKYPHIFKKLEWWEDRFKGDMPIYVMNIADNTKFKLVDIHRDRDCAFLKGFGWHNLTDLTPITEEEYNLKPFTP